MRIDRAHDIYSELTSVHVDDLEFFDGETLSHALRYPRPRLADTLVERGVLSLNVRTKLSELWAAMQEVRPSEEGDVRTFENIYELLLWVYVETTQFENAADESRRCKLVFRGQRDMRWKLETTKHRLIKSAEAKERNEKRIALFIRAVKATFPQKLLETELEQEAVAQHYGEDTAVGRHDGFATSLLDFTPDIDVAAYFATQKSNLSELGTIFMSDTNSLLVDGRIRIVKIPELFERPNAQRGLFLRIPETMEVDGPTALERHFTRLNFRQHSLDRFACLHQATASVLPSDAVAKLADLVKTDQSAFDLPALSEKLATFGMEMLHNPKNPEILAFGSRLASYAGIITDEAKLCLLTNVIQEIVRTSTAGVRAFIKHVFFLTAQTLYFSDEGDVSFLMPFHELARNLSLTCQSEGIDISDLEKAFRATQPRSILFLGSEQRALQERAQRAATRLWQIASPDDTSASAELARIDFAESRARDRRGEQLEVFEVMRPVLVILNIDCLVESEGEASAAEYLHELSRLGCRVVATAKIGQHGLFLGRYFDLSTAGNINPTLD